MHCKFCGSDEHNSQTHPACPYWNACGIITLLYNDYYVRNQGFSSGYQVVRGELDSYWKIGSINIEFSNNTKKILNKLKRQAKVIEYLCKCNDFYGTTDETIHLIDSLHFKR